MFAQTALVAEIGKLQKFAYRLTRNKPDADDLVQSTCLRALEKAESFKDGTNLSGWASKIMFNLFATGYRRKTKFETQYDPDLHIAKEIVEPSQDVDMELANVMRAIKRLSVGHQEILNLACINGLHYDEVSKKLGIPVGTVRSRLSRAREQLQITLNTPAAKPVLRTWHNDRSANRNTPYIPSYIASWAMRKDSL